MKLDLTFDDVVKVLKALGTYSYTHNQTAACGYKQLEKKVTAQFKKHLEEDTVAGLYNPDEDGSPF